MRRTSATIRGRSREFWWANRMEHRCRSAKLPISASVRALVDREVSLPTGYWLRWSGEYEALARVKARLQVVVPLTLAIIALLLYLTFGTVGETAIVMLSLPFALVGGVWIMWLLGYNLSVAVAVGFIALAGVSAEIGVVMMLYLGRAWASRPGGAESAPSLHQLQDAIERGAVLRVRPILMTAFAIMLDRKSTRLNSSH